MRRFALFDFDGTLTRKDTTRYLLIELLKLRPWLAFRLAALVFARMLGSPATLQYAKNRCIGNLLKGLSDEQVVGVASAFKRAVEPLLLPSILEFAREYQRSGTQVIVVTASPEFAVSRMVDGDGFWCVGTRYQASGGVYSGMLDGAPCYGEGKISALRRQGIGQEDRILSAWSDALSDLPMMLLADERYWVGSRVALAEIHAADPGGKMICTEPGH